MKPAFGFDTDKKKDPPFIFQSTVYFSEILKLKKLFREAKIDFLFLKGLPLHLYFEKSYPKRILADCDILIDKNAGLKAGKIFNFLGYRLAETSYSKLHRRLKDKLTEVTYFKVVNNCMVVFDVHFEIVFLMNQLGRLDALYPQKSVDGITREFLDNKQTVKVGGQKFSILAPADLIIYLGLHFFHHNFKGRNRLEFWHKVISYYKKQPVDRLDENIIDKIKRYKIQNFVYPGFALVNKHFDTPLFPKFMKLIAPAAGAKKYVDEIVNTADIDRAEDHLAAGINRFKNIFYLSPRPWHRKILVFFNPAVIYSLIWSMVKKLTFFLRPR